MTRPLLAACVALWLAVAALWWNHELPGSGYVLLAAAFGGAAAVLLLRAAILRVRGRSSR